MQSEVMTECVGCLDHAVKKDWSGVLSCLLMVALGSVVRYFEKSYIRKRNEPKDKIEK